MKNSKNSITRTVAGVMLVLASASGLSGCFLTQKSDNASTGAAPGLKGPGTVGIRNVNSLMASITTVTKLSPMTMVPNTTGGQQTLATTYNNIAPFISSNGNIAGVNSAMLLAITGFAGTACQAWLKNEAAAEASKAGSSMADGGVNFGAGPSGITPALATTIATNYATLFWGRPPTADELQILVTAITSAQTAVNTTGTTGTQQVLLVPCTAALASPAFLAS
jgi:hypothetical protein